MQEGSPNNPTIINDQNAFLFYNPLMKHLSLPVVIEGDQDGYFVSCPALQGCYSQGETYEQAVENIKDAIHLHIQDRLAAGEEVPEPVSISLSMVEVAV